nr:hypothetical protein [Acidimicrobiia bacterium]
MDWKRFDRVRRNSGAVHLDLVESYAQGRISRRAFVRRGAVVGLSIPTMAAVIAACGDDDEGSPATGGSGTQSGGTAQAGSTTPGTSGASSGPATQGGVIRIGSQIPGALDPIAMQDLGAYGIIAQSFEF